MDELHIARSTAAILDRLSNSSSGDHNHNHNHNSSPRRRVVPDKRFFSCGGGKLLSEEEVEFVKLRTMTYELAVSRAREACRDLATVLRETEIGVAVELARILAGTVDPVLGKLEKVVVEEEEDGEVCGVCQEEMEGGDDVRAMGCLHRFHAFCIWKWLRDNNTCPLCRFSHHTHTH